MVYFGLERPAPNSDDGPQDAEGLQAIARAARQTVSEQVIRCPNSPRDLGRVLLRQCRCVQEDVLRSPILSAPSGAVEEPPEPRSQRLHQDLAALGLTAQSPTAAARGWRVEDGGPMQRWWWEEEPVRPTTMLRGLRRPHFMR